MPALGPSRSRLARGGCSTSPYADDYRLASGSPPTPSTPYDAVRAIEGHLRGRTIDYTPTVPEHTYPLDVVPVRGSGRLLPAVRGLDGLMLRMVGIPSRVVSGLRPGSPRRASAAPTRSATSTPTPGSRSTSAASAGLPSTRPRRLRRPRLSGPVAAGPRFCAAARGGTRPGPRPGPEPRGERRRRRGAANRLRFGSRLPLLVLAAVAARRPRRRNRLLAPPARLGPRRVRSRRSSVSFDTRSNGSAGQLRPDVTLLGARAALRDGRAEARSLATRPPCASTATRRPVDPRRARASAATCAGRSRAVARAGACADCSRSRPADRRGAGRERQRRGFERRPARDGAGALALDGAAPRLDVRRAARQHRRLGAAGGLGRLAVGRRDLVFVDALRPGRRRAASGAGPIELASGAERIHALTTISFHRREPRPLVERYGAGTSRARAELPEGIEPMPLSGAGEVEFWLGEHRALVTGDRMLGAPGGGLRLCPQSWLGYLPNGITLDAASRCCFARCSSCRSSGCWSRTASRCSATGARRSRRRSDERCGSRPRRRARDVPLLRRGRARGSRAVLHRDARAARRSRAGRRASRCGSAPGCCCCSSASARRARRADRRPRHERARPRLPPRGRLGRLRGLARAISSAPGSRSPTSTSGEAGCRSFYFNDPAGNLLEIADGDLWPSARAS